MQLPSRKELPDYYEVIEHPMDINKIRKKIKDGRYRDIDEMGRDVILLCKNAQAYNRDGSDIFNDSILLENIWEKAKAKFTPPVATAETTPTPGAGGK